MNARSKSYIDPEVQGALARRLIAHWVVFIGVAAMLMFGLHWLGDPFTPLPEHFSKVTTIYGPALLVLVCLAPVFIYDSMKLSNRFTGPMLRIRNATRELANGERPSKINLRGGDFWQEVADDFNRVIDRLDNEADVADRS